MLSRQVSFDSKTNSLDEAATHSRLLLAALLENFCDLYESNPVQSARLFRLICTALEELHILDREHLDSMTLVRSRYSNAFRSLLQQARASSADTSVPPGQDLTNYRRGFHNTKALKDSSVSTSATSYQSSAGHYDGPTGPDVPRNEDVHVKVKDWLNYHDSRYASDFKELGLLGRGGFGAVWHARNRIDNAEYAVKKIRLDRSTAGPRMFREIQCLASMDHPNVIRYYSSWLEHTYDFEGSTERKRRKSVPLDMSNGLPAQFPPDISDTARHSFDQETVALTEESVSGSNHVHSIQDNSESIVFEYSDLPSRHEPDCAEKTPDKASSEVEAAEADIDSDTKSADLAGSYKSLSKAMEIMALDSHHQTYMTLYIQMKLCPLTLYAWIKKRKLSSFAQGIDKEHCDRLFQGILQGCRYVHDDVRLVHRDLKPRNVFLAQVPGQGSWPGIEVQDGLRVIPKIGDFGLVSDVDEEDVIAAGTIAYAPPERTSQPSVRADVYALGIIYFEMLHPFATFMERAKALTELRRGVLPEHFVMQLPKESALILWMTSKSPIQRPTIQTVLDSELWNSIIGHEPNNEIDALKKRCTEYELENQTLRQRIVALESRTKGASPAM